MPNDPTRNTHSQYVNLIDVNSANQLVINPDGSINVTISGPFPIPVVHLDDSVDLPSTPAFYWIDTGGQDDIHIGLPSAVGNTGFVYHINATQADFMDVHVTVGGQKIDGSTTPLDIHNSIRSFISDGSNWHTIA